MKPILKLPLPLLALNTIAANAQKLPNVQTKSVYAPASVKINGKASEWNDNFQAYNKAAEILYTISNDDQNLYLTARAKKRDIIDKIMRGGITFIINREADKKNTNTLYVTYPILEGPAMWEVANKFAGQSIAYRNHESVNVKQLNNLFAKREKLIMVTGIKEIPDSSVSVYNTDGIAAASLFNGQLAYTYELALPIKYLKLANSSGGTFDYQIKLNPDPTIKKPGTMTADMPPPPPVMEGTLATTDFKGKYTLAKKP